MLYISIATLIAAAVTCALVFGCRKVSQETCQKIIKGVAYAFILLCLWRKFMPDGFIFVNNIEGDGTPIMPKDNFHSILRWGLEVCSVVNVVALLCENKFFKNVSIAFCFPVAVASLVCINKFFAYFTGMVDSHWDNIHIPHFFQYAQFMLELAFNIAIPFVLIFVTKHKPFATKQDALHFALGIIPVIIACIPMFAPRALFGVTNIRVSRNPVGTAIWIVSFVSLAFFGYFFFRFKNADTRYSIVLFLSTALVMFFAEKGVLGPTLSRVSIFQFCNIANYLLYIAILFRVQFLFEYMLFANTVGAIIAFCFPDVSSGLFNPWDLHFFVDHAMLLTLPPMTLGLRVFARPSKRSLFNTLMCFTVYFAFCFLSGTIINGIYDNNLLPQKTIDFLSGVGMWSNANFFYLFNHQRILEAAPFLSFVYAWRLPLGPFEVYPIWIVFFYVMFSGVIAAVYFAEIGFIKLGDKHFAWRARRIEEYQQKTGKQSKRKIAYDD